MHRHMVAWWEGRRWGRWQAWEGGARWEGGRWGREEVGGRVRRRDGMEEEEEGERL